MSPSRPDPQGSLPAQLTGFIGRHREIAELGELLTERRMVTITGAGGAGKTRLAIEAAARDGREAVWVDLSPITPGEEISEHLVARLGIRADGVETSEAVLVRALQPRELLLVLDNCEHVLDAVVPLLTHLLATCPRLRVLTTSREPLGIRGEVAWLLPPLSLPPPEAESAAAVATSEAVALFVSRAREAAPSFVLHDGNAAAVAEICRRLDGLPLAVELAAARVTVLAPGQILDRLSDRFRLLISGTRSGPSRHRTLEEVLRWSYDLLTSAEQAVLRRLTVFSGDFSLDAAEHVAAGGGVSPEDVLDLVGALVSKSLVVVEPGAEEVRYRLLETIRQFAATRPDPDGGRHDAARRHAEFFLAGATAREEGVYDGGSDPSHLAWFEAEASEFRAAAHWFARQSDRVDDALRLATAPAWFWFVRGRFPEGRRWLEQALHHVGGEGPPPARGRALAALSLLAFSQGDVKAQRLNAEAAIQHLRGSAARGSFALALALAGQACSVSGEHDHARKLLEEAVSVARASRCQELVSVLAFRGSGASMAGEFDIAVEAWTEACDRARRLGLSNSEPHFTDGLGRLAFAQADYALARRYFARTLDIEPDSPWCRALGVQGAACIALMDGRPALAAELLGAAEVARERIGIPPRPEEALFLEGLQARAVEELGAAAYEAAHATGARMKLEEALELARTGGSAPFHSTGQAEPPHPLQPGTAASSDAPPFGGTRRPWLSVSALGPLEIRIDGEPVDADAWSHARPRELLIYLLCFPEGRTRGQVGLDFWPDSSSAQVKNSFHVLLHKLRKALGEKAAVLVEGERYRISPELDLWFDAAVFEREVQRALGQSAAGPEAARTLTRALELYRGDFMEGEPAGDWHIEVHDRLQRLRAEALSALADLQIEQGDLPSAVTSLESLTLAEPLREDGYRRLMVCLARLSRRDRALLHYTRLVTLLQDDLGAAPEPETSALADEIRSAQMV